MTKDNYTLTDIDDAFLDAAAAEAIGTHGVEESDAFVQTLARSGEQERRTARELRETVARMAAGGPYMEPSAALRGKILGATAPQNFKMDDYRRSGEQSPRVLRWGMVAAVMFLTAAAWYNGVLKSNLTQKDQQLAEMNSILMKGQEELSKGKLAMQRFVDPMVQQQQIVAKGPDGQSMPIGKLLYDPRSNEGMVVMPSQMLPAGMKASVTIIQDGKETKVPMAMVDSGEFATATLKGNGVNPQKPWQMQAGDQRVGVAAMR